MLKVSLRSDLRRNEFFLPECVARIMSLLRFASSLVRMPERRLISKFTTLFIRRTLRRMPIVTSIPSWTITFSSAKQIGWFSFPEGLARPSFQGITSWRVRRSRTLSFPFGFSPLLRIVFHSTLVSSRALTLSCPLYTMSILSFSSTLVPPSFSVCYSLSIFISVQYGFSCFDFFR